MSLKEKSEMNQKDNIDSLETAERFFRLVSLEASIARSAKHDETGSAIRKSKRP